MDGLFSYSRKNQKLEPVHVVKDCKNNFVYRLAWPVFSKDLKTVIIGITEDCNCLLGGQGYKAVYQLQEGRWVKVHTYDKWIG